MASTLLIVVWTVYKCFLANLGKFRFNRIFLLFCVVLSFILPLFILNPFWVRNMVTENMDISLDPIEIAYIADTVSEKIIPIWDYHYHSLPYRGYCYDAIFSRFYYKACTVHY